MRRIKAIVHRHELQRQPVNVPAWEIPLLQAIYQGAVQITEEIDDDDPVPTAEAEYDRLERKYREFRDDRGDYTGETVVGAVYGRFQTGVDALAKAIAATEQEDSDALDALRDQAVELGIDVDRRWGEKRLRAEIDKAARAAA